MTDDTDPGTLRQDTQLTVALSIAYLTLLTELKRQLNFEVLPLSRGLHNSAMAIRSELPLAADHLDLLIRQMDAEPKP